MITTTVSSKFQVVIPLAVRKLLKIAPGDRFQVFPYQGRIELVPIRPVEEMRGVLAGIDREAASDDDRV
jgi:AbrB family looped-hinge helix DNA binding protein